MFNRFILFALLVASGASVARASLPEQFECTDTMPCTEEPPDNNSKILFEWTGGSGLQWPFSYSETVYKNSGRYMERNFIASRVAIHKDELILAFPRFNAGIPATLVRATMKGSDGVLKLTAFPSWAAQEEGNCDSIQSAVDFVLDFKQILWVLDTGIVKNPETAIRTCLPKIVVINVKTRKMIKVVDISSLTNHRSRLQHLVVNYNEEGHVYAYVSDAASRSIIVVDVKSSQGHRIILPKYVAQDYSQKDKLYMTLIQWPDGVKNILFSYLSSRSVYSIKTELVESGEPDKMVYENGPRMGKIFYLGTDGGTAIYFRKQSESDVYKWDLLDSEDSECIEKVYTGSLNAVPSHVIPDPEGGGVLLLESYVSDNENGTLDYGVHHTLKMI